MALEPEGWVDDDEDDEEGDDEDIDDEDWEDDEDDDCRPEHSPDDVERHRLRR